MVGLGETRGQILKLLDDLRTAGCEFLTIGQYLRPSKQNPEVTEFITPEAFEELGEIARAKGFSFVASAPFVRSSYHAGEALR
jgi:lipoic acid synthetase